MRTTKPIASLSLDLDNKWSYLKTHGEASWESLPTYLPLVVPRILRILHQRSLTITFFVVGQDADQTENYAPLQAIAHAGHEIGNHSYHHEPWLQLYGDFQIAGELARAEDAIAKATGQRPIGFRGPGFSLSAGTLKTLVRRGYQYDASTFPTFLGPLARAYYFMTAQLSAEQKRERGSLFGDFRDGFRPNKPYCWQTEVGPITEIPVTVMPFLRTPFHVSYLLYLSLYSHRLARCYFRTALRLCRASNTAPSLLMHPLDFLGRDDMDDLSFFPAMNVASETKMRWVSSFLDDFMRRYHVAPMRVHAAALGQAEKLPRHAPDFARAALASLGATP